MGNGVSIKEITITKTVPVTDRETLTVWLNQELEEWLSVKKRDACVPQKTAGFKALQLIEEAGFHLDAPTISR